MTDSREALIALIQSFSIETVIRSFYARGSGETAGYALDNASAERIADAILALRAAPARCDAVTRDALIEQCAKIADPWPGFNVGQKIQEPDLSVIEVRTKIAAAIRALAHTAADRGDDPFAGLPRCTECGAIAGILCDYTKCPGAMSSTHRGADQ